MEGGVLGKIHGEGAVGHLFPVSGPGVMKWSMKSTACRAVSTAVLFFGSTLGCSDASGDLDTGLGGPSGGGGDVIGAGGNGVPGTGGDPVSGAGGIAAATGGSGGTGGSGPIVHPTCPGDAANAHQGTARAIPGTIEAEDFDPEGYSDTTPGNEDGAYRTDVDVDIKALGDGYAISWFVSGEWLEYTVNVATEGAYAVTAQAGAVEAGRTLELSSCGEALGTIAVPRIDDWGQVKTSAPVVVQLSAGVQVIRVSVGALDYADLDSLTFEPWDGETPGSGGTGGTGGDDGSGGGSGGELPKFVGNITTHDQVDTDGLVFSDYWDQITPENAGKWGSVQPNAGSGRNWSTLDALYDYAEDHGIIFKQHAFVWGAQQPSGNLTEDDVRSWISEFCSRYPNTRLIDVVNEPPPHTEPSYANAIGGGTNGSWQWIINAFEWAHESCPDAILILNDYNNIEYSDQNQHFINIAKAVKNAGAPIHAVGAQSHALHGQYGASTQTMKTLLTKLHQDTGLPVYITEYDIGEANDQIQLTKYQEHLTFFLETEWIHGITLWGWINGKTWIDNSGIMNGGSPRPAMTWLMNELGRPVP